LFVPFGFDHPSSLGLDFDHFALLLLAHVVALIIGVAIAFKTHQYGFAFCQIAVTGVPVFLAFMGLI
jgi:hypothetical protein